MTLQKDAHKKSTLQTIRDFKEDVVLLLEEYFGNIKSFRIEKDGIKLETQLLFPASL